MKPQDALALLQDKIAAHGLSPLGWTGSLDSSASRFGLCRPSRKEISLSRTLVSLNSEKEVLDTILHEIAHALAVTETGENCGHDERWKAICRRIGARPERCYDASEVTTPDAPWVLVHRDTGEVLSHCQRRPQGDLSQLYLKGRKRETLGQLQVRANPALATQPLQYFDKQHALSIQQRILDTLLPLAKELGVTIQSQAIHFQKSEAKMDLQVSIIPEDGLSAEQREFNQLATLFGLSEADYERPLQSQDRTYFLIGFKLRNRKYPIIVRTSKGTRYKLPLEALQGLA